MQHEKRFFFCLYMLVAYLTGAAPDPSEGQKTWVRFGQDNSGTTGPILPRFQHNFTNTCASDLCLRIVNLSMFSTFRKLLNLENQKRGKKMS